MVKKHWIYFKREFVTEPAHQRELGDRIWLYLYMLDRADWTTGIIYDWKDRDAAAELGMSIFTLRYQRKAIEHSGYISKIQHKRSTDIIIHNWINPRRYDGQVINERDYPFLTEGDNKLLPLEIEDSEGDNKGYNKGYNKGSNLTVEKTPSSLSSKIIDHRSDHGAEKTPRPRDPIFDAIVQVTRIDPATAGPSIGKVKQILLKADPPYTAEEVLKFGASWPVWKDTPPTLWQLKEQIGTVRQNGKGASNGTHQEPAYTPEQLAAAAIINARRAEKRAANG